MVPFLIVILAVCVAGCAGGLHSRTITIPGVNPRAVALVQKGMAAEEPADQADCYLKAILIDPDYARAHANLGVVHFRQGAHGDAARSLLRAVELEPTEADHHYNLGVVYERCAKIDQAIRCYRDTLALSVDSLPAMENLARCYVKRGDDEEELKLLLKKIVIEEMREDWIQWAQLQLVRIENRHKYADNEL